MRICVRKTTYRQVFNRFGGKCRGGFLLYEKRVVKGCAMGKHQIAIVHDWMSREMTCDALTDVSCNSIIVNAEEDLGLRRKLIAVFGK